MESFTVLRNMTGKLPENKMNEGNRDENFYSPLSLKGYLTPLQRKKLREMRNFNLPISEPKDIKKVIKSHIINRKKGHRSAPNKSKGPTKKIKQRVCTSQIQCSAAKVICKNFIVKNKKFFKASSPNRLEKANFSMPFVFTKSLFSQIDKSAKENLLQSKRRLFKEQCNNSYSLNKIQSDENATNIPMSCFVEENINNKNKCSLERSSDKVAEESSVFDFVWPSDDELLKRQEVARANIKKQRALKEFELKLKSDKEQENIAEPLKLYPIFYMTAKKKQSTNLPELKRKQKNSSKQIKKSVNDGKQMIIDAGQKEIGAKICSTCNMIYTVALEDDEKIHLNYHNTYLFNLKFLGWKQENVIGEYKDGRVIMVHKKDQPFKIKKIKDVLEIANRDLGFPSSALPSKPDLTFILFISNAKEVAGCVVAEPISLASRVLLPESGSQSNSLFGNQNKSTWRIGNWYSSSEMVPAVCGINRIWVAHNYRRCKIASRMVDCLRCQFVYGHVIGIRELAFTDPTPNGREFAASYTGTENFLVYK